MKDDKPWYEKVGIWIGIIAGILTILGIGNNALVNDDKTNIDEINLKNSKIETSSGNIIGHDNIDFSNTQDVDLNNFYIE